MTKFLITRIIGMLPTALIVGIVAFFLVHLSPGDPAAFFAAPDATEVELDLVRARLGLDQPLFVQFFYWLRSVLQGDLGVSFFSAEPVLGLFLRALPATLYLTFASLLISTVIAIPMGVLAALRHNTKTDNLLTILVLIGMSMPHFWLGMLLVLLFAINLGWFPAQGFVRPEVDAVASLRHIALPALALGYSSAALIARMARSSMLDVLSHDYVRTARSKGLRDRVVVWKHAFANAANPVLTVVGLTLVELISGAVVIETVFNYPGIGRLVVNAVLRNDYPLVQACLLLTAVLIMISNLLIDIGYALFDPRIRYES